MPCRYPAEFRSQMIELARSGTEVKQLATTFQMSEVTIYNWLKQERIDRGEAEGRLPASSLSSPPPSVGSGSLTELAVARKGQRSVLE
jgi:transposase